MVKFSLAIAAISAAVPVASQAQLRAPGHAARVPRHLEDKSGFTDGSLSMIETIKDAGEGTSGSEKGAGKSGKGVGGKSDKGKHGKSVKSTCDAYSPPSFTAVFTMTNQPENKILMYSRNAEDGTLSFVRRFDTGGSGSQTTLPPPFDPSPVNDPFAATGSIVVAGDGTQRCLLAVNAGSDTVSSFRILSEELIELADIQNVGWFPVSIAEREGLVYVLGAAGQGSVTGFDLTMYNCKLRPGSSAVLDQDAAVEFPPIKASSPAQVGFTPGGKVLVTIKQNGGGAPDPANRFGTLNVYDMNLTGLIQTSVRTRDGSFNGGPFSFTFDADGSLLLLEIFGNGGTLVNGGSVGVYEDIESPSPQLASFAAAESTTTCWIQYNPRTNCVYATNNGGSSISSFELYGGRPAKIKLVSNETALLNAPIDMAMSRDLTYLYVMSTGHTDGTGQPQIYTYEMKCGCLLEEVQAVSDGLDDEETRAADNADGVVNGVVGLAIYDP